MDSTHHEPSIVELKETLNALKSELKIVKDNMKTRLAQEASQKSGRGDDSGGGGGGGGVGEGDLTMGSDGVPPKNIREIFSLSSGLCLDYNPYQYKGKLMTWSCHRGEFICFTW